MFKTMAQLIKAHKEAGFYFFTKGAMEFFDSKIESEVMYGCFFITSEAFYEDAREYSVRCIDKSMQIDTLGVRYSTKQEAIDFITEFAKAGKYV